MSIFNNNILAGAAAQSSGSVVHTIDQSIRFNRSDTPYMTRTPSGAGNTKKWTLSWWEKRGAGVNLTNQNEYTFHTSPAGANNASYIYNYNNHPYYWEAGNTYIATIKLRDPSAWYNNVVVYDSANPVALERIKLFINGTRITDFSTYGGITLNQDSYWNSATAHYISNTSSSSCVDGYLAEIVFIDGQALDPSSFAETNSSGIWIPKDVSDLTFGSNGFYLKGADSSALGTDSSGNGNNFTTNGLAAHDQVLDSPTNNFCVMSPIDQSSFTLSEGNLETAYGSNNSTSGVKGTVGVSTGKWYWEGRRNVANVYHCQVGVASTEVSPTKLPPSNTPDNGGSTVGYWGTSLYKDGVAVQTGLAASVNGDIIGLALDLDSTPNTVTFTKNGSALGTAVSVTSGFTWTPCEGTNPTGYTANVNTSHNFGQDGTMAGLITAGGNSDANGIGNFKYSVPSGHLAVCTKNIGGD